MDRQLTFLRVNECYNDGFFDDDNWSFNFSEEDLDFFRLEGLE